MEAMHFSPLLAAAAVAESPREKQVCHRPAQIAMKEAGPSFPGQDVEGQIWETETPQEGAKRQHKQLHHHLAHIQKRASELESPVCAGFSIINVFLLSCSSISK